MSEKKVLPNSLAGWMFAYNIVLSLTALYVLLCIWPNTVPKPSNQTNQWLTNETVRVFGSSFVVSGEVTVLWIVMILGALGALVYTSTQIVGRVVSDKEVASWNNSYALWYLVHPLLGSSLAVIFYVVLRGGLVNLSVGTAGLNLYGVAAISGLVGLSSKEATDKLEEIFITLFSKKSTQDGTPTADKKAPAADQNGDAAGTKKEDASADKKGDAADTQQKKTEYQYQLIPTDDKATLLGQLNSGSEFVSQTSAYVIIRTPKAA